MKSVSAHAGRLLALKKFQAAALIVVGVLIGVVFVPQNLSSEALIAFGEDVRHSAIGPAIGAFLSIFTALWIEDKKRERKEQRERALLIAFIKDMQEEYAGLCTKVFQEGAVARRVSKPFLLRLRRDAEQQYTILQEIRKTIQLEHLDHIIFLQALVVEMGQRLQPFNDAYDAFVESRSEEALESANLTAGLLTSSVSVSALSALRALEAGA